MEEKSVKEDVIVKTVTGEEINIGKNPRVLIMAEESGGAAMGGTGYITSKSGKKKSLAMKEKDGMQIAAVILGLGAKLFLEGKSFAEFYDEIIEKYDITFRFYDRMDITLYDENLPPEKLREAKLAGLEKRDRIVKFFKSLIGKSPEIVKEELDARTSDFKFPQVNKIIWAGDGTLIDFEDFWWEIRSSGTDAVLRYYIEGRNKEKILDINNKFRELDI
jgi:phosphomannomutase